jgi:hypothetical protein
VRVGYAVGPSRPHRLCATDWRGLRARLEAVGDLVRCSVAWRHAVCCMLHRRCNTAVRCNTGCLASGSRPSRSHAAPSPRYVPH